MIHTGNGKTQLQDFIRVIRTHKNSPGKGQTPNSQSKHKNQNKPTNQNFRIDMTCNNDSVTNTEQTGYINT